MDSKATWETDIVWRRIDNNVVVIKQDGRTLCTLNTTAAYIWEMCNGEYTVQDIVQAICQKYEVSEEEALKDVLDTLSNFKEIGLIGKE